MRFFLRHPFKWVLLQFRWLKKEGPTANISSQTPSNESAVQNTNMSKNEDILDPGAHANYNETSNDETPADRDCTTSREVTITNSSENHPNSESVGKSSNCRPAPVDFSPSSSNSQSNEEDLMFRRIFNAEFITLSPSQSTQNCGGVEEIPSCEQTVKNKVTTAEMALIRSTSQVNQSSKELETVSLSPIFKLPPDLVQYLTKNFLRPSTAALLAITSKHFYFVIGRPWEWDTWGERCKYQLLWDLERDFPSLLNCCLCRKLHPPLPFPTISDKEIVRTCDRLERFEGQYNMLLGLPDAFRYDMVQMAMKSSRLGVNPEPFLKQLQTEIMDVGPKLQCTVSLNGRLSGRIITPTDPAGGVGMISHHQLTFNRATGPGNYQVNGLHSNCTLEGFQWAKHPRYFLFQPKVVGNVFMSRSQQWAFVKDADVLPLVHHIQFAACAHLLYSYQDGELGRAVYYRCIEWSQGRREWSDPITMQCKYCETDLQLDCTEFKSSRLDLYLALIVTTWKNFGLGQKNTDPRLLAHKFNVLLDTSILFRQDRLPEHKFPLGMLVKYRQNSLQDRASVKDDFEQGNSFSFWNGGLTKEKRNSISCFLTFKEAYGEHGLHYQGRQH